LPPGKKINSFSGLLDMYCSIPLMRENCFASVHV
jgi:hypothetical protein